MCKIDFLPCKPNKSFWVCDKYSSHLFWAGIVHYLLTCTTLYSTLLGQYCTVFTDIYYTCTVFTEVYYTHLFWAGIVRYLLKCTTLYSSLLGWYCTVFTDMYYTILISSGLVLYLLTYSECYNKTKLCVAHFAKQHPHSPPLPMVSLYQVAAEEAGRLRNFSRLTDS